MPTAVQAMMLNMAAVLVKTRWWQDLALALAKGLPPGVLQAGLIEGHRPQPAELAVHLQPEAVARGGAPAQQGPRSTST